jgi:hypothetical protein
VYDDDGEAYDEDDSGRGSDRFSDEEDAMAETQFVPLWYMVGTDKQRGT